MKETIAPQPSEEDERQDLVKSGEEGLDEQGRGLSVMKLGVAMSIVGSAGIIFGVGVGVPTLLAKEEQEKDSPAIAAAKAKVIKTLGGGGVEKSLWASGIPLAIKCHADKSATKAHTIAVQNARNELKNTCDDAEYTEFAKSHDSKVEGKTVTCVRLEARNCKPVGRIKQPIKD